MSFFITVQHKPLKSIELSASWTSKGKRALSDCKHNQTGPSRKKYGNRHNTKTKQVVRLSFLAFSRNVFDGFVDQEIKT